jgi:hypothetical protein
MENYFSFRLFAHDFYMFDLEKEAIRKVNPFQYLETQEDRKDMDVSFSKFMKRAIKKVNFVTEFG